MDISFRVFDCIKDSLDSSNYKAYDERVSAILHALQEELPTVIDEIIRRLAKEQDWQE
ncbi:MAG: hypothetical protein HYX84_02560 [Chloroflexi bacterium]|nr:hypothetical protein [Chloroflexota bacterium]